MSLLLGFVLKLGGKGLYMGISFGSIVQFLLLAFITFFSNWQKMVRSFTYFALHLSLLCAKELLSCCLFLQSDKARERAFGESLAEKGAVAV
jgi:hypothetical protein